MHATAFARLAPLTLADGGAAAVGWSLVVIVCVIGGFYTIAWVRRWMKDDEVSAIGLGFTLGDLRDLHRRGEMTDEEYEKARAKIVQGTQFEAQKIKPAGFPVGDTKNSVDAIRARTAARRAVGENPPRAIDEIPPRAADKIPPRSADGMPPPLRPPSDKPR